MSKNVYEMLKTVPYNNVSLLADIVTEEMQEQKFKIHDIAIMSEYLSYLIDVIGGNNPQYTLKDLRERELTKDKQEAFNKIIIKSINKYHEKY
ncbi:hypothetical protein JEM48_03610 [Ligilactobacillus salivarius]|nr:hypothetical protein [Ligilactobacillus salivarius]